MLSDKMSARTAIWLVSGILAACTAITFTGPSAANGRLPPPVEAWYEALGATDRATIGKLLADGAIIDLRDLGITQTREEFLDSLDAWAEANREAEILARPGLSAGMNQNDTTVVEVCYRFPSNEALFEESFRLDGELIIKSVQRKISETCEGF